MTTAPSGPGRYAGLSAEERRAGRRTRLIEATLDVWAEPETSVTVTAVCARASLTERYFYESFTGLDEALTTVLELIAQEIAERAVSASKEAGADPTARVRAAATALVELVTEDPRRGRVVIIEAAARPALRERRTALLRDFARLAADEARDYYGPGRWGPGDGEVAGLLYVGGLVELFAAWLDGDLQATAEEIVDAATAAFTGMHR